MTRAVTRAVTRERLRLRGWHVTHLADQLLGALPAPPPLRARFVADAVPVLALLLAMLPLASVLEDVRRHRGAFEARHVREQVADGALPVHYRLRRGPSSTRISAALLRLTGGLDEVVQLAEATVEGEASRAQQQRAPGRE